MLAVITGIPAREWANEGLRGIATALEVLEEMNNPDKGSKSSSDGRQYSG